MSAINPLVSIIIPVYNAEPFLQKCLDSILNQSYKNIEVITVNDGSTDNSASILSDYSRRYDRISVIFQKNQGHQAARQAGITTATGEYICFVDSDDSLVPQAIQIMVECAQETNVKFVVSRINIETNTNKRLFPSDVFGTISAKKYLEQYLLCGRVGWNICSKLFKSELIKANITIPIKVTAGEDALFIILLVSRMDGNVSMVNIPTYNYYVRPNSITHSKNVKYIYDNFHVADYIELQLKNQIKAECLVAFRLLCMSNSFRYGWLGKFHSLNMEAINKYNENKSVLKRFRFKRRLQLFLLIHFGDFLSKYVFKNSIDNESKNS